MSNKPVKEIGLQQRAEVQKKSNHHISQETIPKETFNNEVKPFTVSLLF